MRALILASFAALVGCGTPEKSDYIDGFNPAPVLARYTRFVTPVIKDIQPGQDITYCQWLRAPADHDVLVINSTVQQSKWGHHVVLFSDTANYPVGESHECKTTDMPSVRFLAGGAGEAAQSSVLIAFPPNVVTKIPAGSSIMASTHFINASEQVIDGQAIADLEMIDASDPSASKYTVSGFFTNNGDAFSLPPSATTPYDTTCVVQQDMNFFAYGNHMHEWGFSAFSEVIHLDGTKTMLHEDTTWKPEFATHPTLSKWDVNSLMPVKNGETVHTHCEWDNNTTSAIGFPREMCVGFGFFLPSSADVICSDGMWGN
jgi:hypothetical protein